MLNPDLMDSTALSEIPPDITFKFTKGEGGEIEANKTVLALVSKVFRNMFLIHNTKDKSATEMVMEDTTKPAFQIMLDAIFSVRKVEESLRGKTLDEMFAVLYLVSKYEIPKLPLAVKECISSFPITEDNVLEVATDAAEYSSTFEESVKILLLACAKFLKNKVSDGDWFIRFIAKNGDRMATVHKLSVLMNDIADMPASGHDWCNGCQKKSTECLDGESVKKSNVKVGIKVVWDPSWLNSSGVGEVVRKKSEFFWVIRWENNEESANYINDGGRYLFKCR